ncbi:MAG TPA: protein kinase [Polyangiaceae bacterium]
MSDAALAATQAFPVSIGAVLADRYEIRAMLGEGGMGAVFRAYDRELDEDVALKVLHLEAAADAAALMRFRREVKLARRVTHRNVARTFDLGTHEKLRFLTMELIGGQSLGALAKRERLALPEILRVGLEIARGLAAAHVVGVVHRDLKPDNVMLCEDRVVLTDFGIARFADGSAPAGSGDLMRTGMIVGTPAYMAPEQLENQDVDGRTDVYALGTILFELLAGRLPFVGESAISLAAQRLTSDAPDVRTLASAVPEGIATFVRELLARRREDRPDAQAVLDRIEALRGNNAPVGRGASRLPTLTSDALATFGQPRTVVVESIEASGDVASLAETLTRAVVDALVESHAAHVVGSAGSSGDLRVEGTLHASGERVRARLRVVGAKGQALWAGHVDGTTADSLALEDGVVAAVVDAVRTRMSRDPGPQDASLREAYEKARSEMQGFALPRVRTAIGILEELEAKKPGDPRVRALLARGLLFAWAQLGARDRATVARAEELALRALEVEPSLAMAHHVIAAVRSNDGELMAAVRAETECLRHDPRNADAHAQLGLLMCEALHVNEGRRRLELAARLEPENTTAAFFELNVLGLVGERDRARARLAETVSRQGPLSSVVVMTRLAVWWNDREMAASAAELIERAQAGASWDHAARIMRSLLAQRVDPEAVTIFGTLTTKDVAPRRRTMMHELAADYFAAMGEKELAIEHVVASARTPSTSLLWLDASPSLASVRSDPRVAEARAVIAARCADLWGAVGTWPNE